MHKIYISKIDDMFEESTSLEVLDMLSEKRREKAVAYKNEEVQKTSIAASYLLEKALVENGYAGDFNYATEALGKPYLTDSKLKFSISHSGSFIAVAISENEIGIDVEDMSRRSGRHFSEQSEKIANRYFSDDDFKYINTSDDAGTSFLEIWTKAESYAKSRGESVYHTLEKKLCFSKMNDIETKTVILGENCAILSVCFA